MFGVNLLLNGSCFTAQLEVFMREHTTLHDHMRELCWSQIELSKRSGVSRATISNAIKGRLITRDSALKIMTCISTEKGVKLSLSDFAGMNVEPATIAHEGVSTWTI
jgi:predicted transcriptional regulator